MAIICGLYQRDYLLMLMVLINRPDRRDMCSTQLLQTELGVPGSGANKPGLADTAVSHHDTLEEKQDINEAENSLE